MSDFRDNLKRMSINSALKLKDTLKTMPDMNQATFNFVKDLTDVHKYTKMNRQFREQKSILKRSEKAGRNIRVNNLNKESYSYSENFANDIKAQASYRQAQQDYYNKNNQSYVDKIRQQTQDMRSRVANREASERTRPKRATKEELNAKYKQQYDSEMEVWNKKKEARDQWNKTKGKRGKRPTIGPKPELRSVNTINRDLKNTSSKDLRSSYNEAVNDARQWNTRTTLDRNSYADAKNRLNRKAIKSNILKNKQMMADTATNATRYESSNKAKIQEEWNNNGKAYRDSILNANRSGNRSAKDIKKSLQGATSFDYVGNSSPFKTFGSNVGDKIAFGNQVDPPPKLQQLFEQAKEFTKPIWEDKVDREADKIVARFSDMRNVQGNSVRGYTANIDGLSTLSDTIENQWTTKAGRSIREHLGSTYKGIISDTALKHDFLKESSSLYRKMANGISSIGNWVKDIPSVNYATNSIGDAIKKTDWYKDRNDSVHEKFLRRGYVDKLSPDMQRYKQLHVNEAAKYVRNYSDNVDPFADTKGIRHANKLRETQEKIRASGTQQNLRLNALKIREQKQALFDNYYKNTVATFEGQGHRDLDKWKALEKEESNIERKLARNERILNSSPGGSYEQTKRWRPQEGITGYGLGAGSFMSASRTELGVRALGFATGAGSGEALMNAFGIRTAGQKDVMKANANKGILARVMSPGAQAQFGAFTSLLYTAATGGDLGDFVSTQLSYASGLQGWRIGSSIGGMVGAGVPQNFGKTTAATITNTLKNNVGKSVVRGGMGVAGGLTGFALGVGAVQAGEWAARDLFSNQSSIRKIAKDFSTKTMFMSTQSNRQTLTSRQMAISKLARSGLNDRSVLLGNEARVLKGVM